MDHVRVCHCLVPRILFGKQGHVHPAVLSHQCHRLQERIWLCDKTWFSDRNRRQTLRHRHGYLSWMLETDGGDCSLGTDGLGDALIKDKAADLLRACVRASAYQLADESSMLQRAREERKTGSFAKAEGKNRRHRRRTADEKRSWKGSQTWKRRNPQRQHQRVACE